MATIPTPLDPPAGQKLTASVFDAGVRDVLNWYMTNRPRAHVYDSSGSQSFSNGGALQLVGFDSEVYDNDGIHLTGTLGTGSTSSSRINFTTPGRYLVDVLLTFPTQTAFSAINLSVNLNAGGVSTAGTILRNQPYSQVNQAAFVLRRMFNAGDYIEFFLNQTSGASRTLSATAFGTRVFTEWLTTI
jgi:hypothetical protein